MQNDKVFKQVKIIMATIQAFECIDLVRLFLRFTPKLLETTNKIFIRLATCNKSNS